MDDLRTRAPGQAVMEKVLDLQGAAPPRSRTGRWVGRTPLAAGSASWFRGALGERRVGPVLDALGPGWTALHAIPLGERDTDVDHLVIGPGGVFSVNTKNHSGQDVWVGGRGFLVAGQKQQHLTKAAAEARRVARCLTRAVEGDVAVRGVVVVVAPRRFTVKAPPTGAEVVLDTRVARWFLAQPPVLSPEEVTRLVAVASQRRTWSSTPRAASDASAARRFEELDRAVRAARRVRLGWLGAAALAVSAVGAWTSAGAVGGLLGALAP